MTPQELKSIISNGLLSFPLTDFDAQGDFNAKADADHCRCRWSYPFCDSVRARGRARRRPRRVVVAALFERSRSRRPDFLKQRWRFTTRCPRTIHRATQHRLLKQFLMPYLDIRIRMQGYAVSIVKAGATLVGQTAGPVRPPLTDLKPAEMEQLGALIKSLGAQ